MNVLSEALKSTNELVTALIVQKSEELEQLDASWLANDELAKTMIKDLQTQCQILSHSAVKLALLVNTSDPGSASLSANIEELCAEIKPQVDTFVAIFVKVTGLTLVKCAFDEIAQAARSIISIYSQLIVKVEERSPDHIRLLAGEITSLKDNTIDKLPLGNKAAIRRHLCKKSLAVRETVNEFNGYIQEAREHQQQTQSAIEDHVFSKTAAAADVVQSREQSQEEDDLDALEAFLEENNQDYSDDEIVIVEKVILLMQTVFDVEWLMVSGMTHIFQHMSHYTPEQQQACELWTSYILFAYDELEQIITLLGEELYPPVEDNTELSSSYNAVHEGLVQLVTRFNDTMQMLGLVTDDEAGSKGRQFIEQMHSKMSSCPRWEALET